MRMKHLLTAIALLLAIGSHAAKMQPGITTVKQSDGTSLNIMAFGDEDMNYLTTTDGVLLFQEGFNYFIAGINDNGELYSTGELAHNAGQRTAREQELISLQNKELFMINTASKARRAKALREPINTSNTLLTHKGSPNIPVILVEFSDSTFSIPNPKTTFTKYLNATELFNKEVDTDMDNNYGSVKRYFSDMSFGQFTPNFDVYGPVNLGKPLVTYGGGASYQEDMKSLLVDACSAVDPDVDFSKYDTNNDGNIDLVYIIYAGYSAAIAGNSQDCIHPKSGTINNSTTFDGKRICRYGVNNELNGGPRNQDKGWRLNGIGVFCHELSHCMGLPDLYPSPGSDAQKCVDQNLDYWSIMDAGEYTNNGYRPTEYTAWERECFGWLTIDTLKAPADITLTTLANNGKAYRIVNDKSENGKEYYIVENVQKEGWNAKIHGHGMTVMHVDYEPSYFTLGGCKVNSTVGHPRVSIIAADGIFMPEYFYMETINADNPLIKDYPMNQKVLDKYIGQTISRDMYYTDLAGDPFPGTSEVSALTDETSPAARVYYGDFMNKPITNITENTEAKTISFKFMGGSDGAAIKEIRTQKQPEKIYSIDGRYIGTDMTRLHKGIYIIGNKKVVRP